MAASRHIYLWLELLFNSFNTCSVTLISEREVNKGTNSLFFSISLSILMALYMHVHGMYYWGTFCRLPVGCY